MWRRSPVVPVALMAVGLLVIFAGVFYPQKVLITASFGLGAVIAGALWALNRLKL